MLFNVTIMSENNDELIKAQNELIGILFEIIKRLQSNNDLDEEYFQIISKKVRTEIENSRLNKITKERENNAEIVSRLLKQIESN
jgi:hypothetical protein